MDLPLYPKVKINSEKNKNKIQFILVRLLYWNYLNIFVIQKKLSYLIKITYSKLLFLIQKFLEIN